MWAITYRFISDANTRSLALRSGEVDAIFDVSHSAAARAMAILSDEVLVTTPLAGTYRIWGTRDRVRGFFAHPSSLSQRWDTVWLVN